MPHCICMPDLTGTQLFWWFLGQFFFSKKQWSVHVPVFSSQEYVGYQATYYFNIGYRLGQCQIQKPTGMSLSGLLCLTAITRLLRWPPPPFYFSIPSSQNRLHFIHRCRDATRRDATQRPTCFSIALGVLHHKRTATMFFLRRLDCLWLADWL